MSTAITQDSISVEDYLAGELTSTVRHEYIAGKVYAMVGGRNAHNTIVINATLILGNALRGGRCRVFPSDTKIHIPLESGTRFYYPDLSVVCDRNPLGDTFQDKPVVVVEVLSESTRRFDETEKQEAYLSLSLTHYLLVEQDSVGVLVYEREGDTFQRRVFTKLTEKIMLPSIGAQIAMSELYDGAIPPQA